MKEEKELKIPEHVGIILDGNRRWAKSNGLPSIEGYRRGYARVSQAIDWFFARGTKVLSFYAFSTENWKRPKEEVDFLMELLKTALEEKIAEAVEKKYCLIVSGRLDELPGDLFSACRAAMAKTAGGERGTVNICLNYGGRAEIVDAVKKICSSRAGAEKIDENLIKENLYNGFLPDPDIIVRTSGEKRLSGFLLWESAYSEFFFLDKCWPDFNEEDVINIFKEYAERERRFGGD